MRGKPLRRAINAFTAVALIFAQFLLPANIALADGADGHSQPVTTDGNSGTLQPVWCKLTGNGWQVQLSANQEGKDGPLMGPLTGYTTNDAGQVLAHDRSDKILADACGTQYSILTTPQQTEVCGPNNDVITAGANMSISSAGTWVNNQRTVTFTADEPYLFYLNGEYSSTATVTYTDANVSCGPTVITTAPTVTPTDVCGPNNDTATISTSDQYTLTNETTWANGQKTFTFTAAEGYVFAGGLSTFSITISDVNTPCSTVISAPVVTQTPVCGENNDTLTVLEGQYTYTDTGWTEGGRTLTFTANPGYTFADGTTFTQQFTDESGPCFLPAPTYTQTPVCGANNDIVVIGEGDYTYTDSGWVAGTRTFTFTANEGSRFTKGKDGKTFILTLTDQNTACIAQYSVDHTYNDQCGIVNDTLTLPADTAQVHYTYIKDIVSTMKFYVTITAQDGYVLNANGDKTYTYPVNIPFTDSPNLICPAAVGGMGSVIPPAPVIVAAATPAPVTAAQSQTVTELPHTGPTTNNAMTLLGLVASIVTYGAVLALQRRHGTA